MKDQKRFRIRKRQVVAQRKEDRRARKLPPVRYGAPTAQPRGKGDEERTR